MSSRALLVAALAAVATLPSACASGGGLPADAESHAALAVPAFFEDRNPGTATAGACRSPMTDPRDGTEVVLARSAGGRGDYEVPAGRYGVGDGELLRLECGSGRPIGVVRR